MDTKLLFGFVQAYACRPFPVTIELIINKISYSCAYYRRISYWERILPKPEHKIAAG